MRNRTFDLNVPLPPDETFGLLLQAGESLPAGEQLGGTRFNRWQNTLADRQACRLEWKMFDHKFATNTIQASLTRKEDGGTHIDFEVHRAGQIFDPKKLYAQTLRLLLEPFVELVKQRVESGL
ncbi:MAG: hypothetical protein JXA78_16880 [Anaerolineales bacterium]|nr:hypothetical protein [Anaerolineales bacterium]